MALGQRAVRTVMLCFPVVGLQIVGANFFQALGKPRKAALLSLSRQILMLIPLLVVLPRFWGLSGVFAAYPLADAGATAVTVFLVWREFAALSQAQAELEPAAVQVR